LASLSIKRNDRPVGYEAPPPRGPGHAPDERWNGRCPRCGAEIGEEHQPDTSCPPGTYDGDSKKVLAFTPPSAGP